MRKSLLIVVSIFMSHEDAIKLIALFCCIIIQQVSSSKSYFDELSQEFKLILNIKILTQLEYSISKFWLESSLNESKIRLELDDSTWRDQSKLDWSSSWVSSWHFEFDSIRSRVAHIFNSTWVKLSIFSTWRDSTRLGIESTRLDPSRIRAWHQES